jgi:hypothetical protein
MRPAGAVVALLAPGTETCRWSGTIRLRPVSGATFRERAQSLVARAAADDLMAQGVALLEQGKGPEGRQVLEQGAALRASVLGDEHWLTLRAQLRVARGLQIDGKTDAALALAQRIVDVQMRTPSTDAFERLRAQAGVATMLWSSGRPGMRFRRCSRCSRSSATVTGRAISRRSLPRSTLGSCSGTWLGSTRRRRISSRCSPRSSRSAASSIRARSTP